MRVIKFSAAKQLIILLSISVFFISCNNDEELGYIVHPKENLLDVLFVNNIPITAHTIKEDSVRTDETILNMVGSYSDPVFGITTAGLYTQFRLTTSAVSFGANPICDSIILSLSYQGGFYGDTSTQMTLNVYEIAEDFDIDNNYYSNQKLGVYKNDLASYAIKPKLKDSVKVGNITYAPHLRVKLKKSLGEKIINASGSSDLATNINFLKFFKGLYITTNKESSGGSIIYLNTTSSISKLTMYYHNDEDTLAYNLIINQNSARFNTFDHYKFSNASSSLQQQIAGDTTMGDNELYLQGMAGLKIQLKFPQALDSSFYSNTPINRIAINKAELVIEANSTILDKYTPPSKLSVVVINKDGTYSFLPDVAYGEAYFGGNYNTQTHEYRFNISKYLQNAFLNGRFEDKGLYLVVSGSAVNANRAVIYGNKSVENSMRLEIIYTKLK